MSQVPLIHWSEVKGKTKANWNKLNNIISKIQIHIKFEFRKRNERDTTYFFIHNIIKRNIISVRKKWQLKKSLALDDLMGRVSTWKRRSRHCCWDGDLRGTHLSTLEPSKNICVPTTPKRAITLTLQNIIQIQVERRREIIKREMAGSGVFAEILDGDVFKYYTDGAWKTSSSGKSVPIINPTTRSTQYKVQGIPFLHPFPFIPTGSFSPFLSLRINFGKRSLSDFLG